MKTYKFKLGKAEVRLSMDGWDADAPGLARALNVLYPIGYRTGEGYDGRDMLASRVAEAKKDLDLKGELPKAEPLPDGHWS